MADHSWGVTFAPKYDTACNQPAVSRCNVPTIRYRLQRPDLQLLVDHSSIQAGPGSLSPWRSSCFLSCHARNLATLETLPPGTVCKLQSSGTDLCKAVVHAGLTPAAPALQAAAVPAKLLQLQGKASIGLHLWSYCLQLCQGVLVGQLLSGHEVADQDRGAARHALGTVHQHNTCRAMNSNASISFACNLCAIYCCY